MTAQELIREILASSNDVKIESFLHSNKDLIDVNLARLLREECYRLWTSEPSKAHKIAKSLRVCAEVCPDYRVHGWSLWTDAIANLIGENLPAADRDLTESRRIFLANNDEYEAARVLVTKVFVAAMRGDLSSALVEVPATIDILIVNQDFITAGRLARNAGIINLRRGTFDDAERYFQNALKILQSVTDPLDTAMTENSLAVLETRRHNFRRAVALYEKALARLPHDTAPTVVADIESSLGELYLLSGVPSKAVEHLQNACELNAKIDVSYRSLIAEAELADAYLEMGLWRESLETYQTVAEKFANAGFSAEHRRNREKRAVVALKLGNIDEAANELAIIYQQLRNEEKEIEAAQTAINLALAENLRGNLSEAASLAESSVRVLANTVFERDYLRACIQKATSFENSGRHLAAHDIWMRVACRATRRHLREIRLESLVALGKNALVRKDLNNSRRFFTKAVKQIETSRAPLSSEEFRIGYFGERTAAYESLAELEANENNLDAMFQLTERARARTLTENVEKPDEDPSAAQITEKRRELNWFYRQRQKEGLSEAEISVADRDIRQMERELDKLYRHQRRSASVVSTPFSIENLQEHLAEDETFVEYIFLGTEIAALVIGRENARLVRKISTVEKVAEIAEKVRFQLGAMRYGKHLSASQEVILNAKIKTHLRDLYENCFARLGDYIGGQKIILAPVKILHSIPFNALFDGENYLIEKFQIALTPSAKVFVECRQRSAASQTSLLVGFADENIPQVAEEIAQLQAVVKQSRVLLGNDANLLSVHGLISSVGVVHFACHAAFRTDNPLHSSLNLADGLLTAREIGEWRIGGSLVVLSACESGLNEIAGGEEVLGLTRGFLNAGAKSLVMSLWKVNDEATSVLMTAFYRNLLHKSPAEALRSAQIQAIRSARHPYYWAAFSITGDGLNKIDI